VKLSWLLALAVAAGSSTRAQVSRQDSFRDVYHLSGLGVVGQAIAGETSCGPNPSGVREVMLLKSIDGPGAARLEWRPGTDGSCEAFLVRSAERQRLFRGPDLPEISYEAAAVAYYEHIDAFVRVFEHTAPPGYWLRISDMPGARIHPWSELLVLSPRNYLGYDGLPLHEQPSESSRILLTLRERQVRETQVHELIPTGEVAGSWGKFVVTEFSSDFYLLARRPDTAPTGNAWQGWLRLTDEKGAPLFWFFTRD
jgi:hypothetical protein